jgi:hypothetical protein
VLDLYHRDDNALFVPETGGASNARFFFTALGLQAIGFSPFGMDSPESRGSIGPNPNARIAFLEPWAMNYGLIGPIQRQIARLNFEGKLQAVAEEKGTVTQTLAFGPWNAIVQYGARRNNRAEGNAEPTGRALVARLKDNQFLVTGFYSRVEFQPADTDKHRQFLKVEEGAYENDVFKMRRIWNGDETDWGLNFGADPVVLRVSLATY